MKWTKRQVKTLIRFDTYLYIYIYICTLYTYVKRVWGLELLCNKNHIDLLTFHGNQNKNEN